MNWNEVVGIVLTVVIVTGLSVALADLLYLLIFKKRR